MSLLVRSSYLNHDLNDNVLSRLYLPLLPTVQSSRANQPARLQDKKSSLTRAKERATEMEVRKLLIPYLPKTS